MSFRDRKFEFVLYPDDETHVKALDIIKQSYQYVYILHDKDLNADGELKKPHWHVLIKGFNSAVWSSSICEQLGIGENCIEKVRNFQSALRYLIHKDDLDKAQYSVDDVQGNLKAEFEKAVGEGMTEEKAISIIFDFLESSDEQISYRDMFKFVLDNGLYGYYRQSYGVIKDLLYQHNEFRRFSEAKEKEFEYSKKQIEELYNEWNEMKR